MIREGVRPCARVANNKHIMMIIETSAWISPDGGIAPLKMSRAAFGRARTSSLILIKTRTTNLRAAHSCAASIALFSSLSGLDLLVKSIICSHNFDVDFAFFSFITLWKSVFGRLLSIATIHLQASYPQRSTDMHLLSSPAHLFSMVLLSVVLGVMTMAVPLTVHNTDIGKSQWHSKRDEIPTFTVSLVRRIGQEQPPLPDDRRSAVTPCSRTLVSVHCLQARILCSTGGASVADQEDSMWEKSQSRAYLRDHPVQGNRCGCRCSQETPERSPFENRKNHRRQSVCSA
ncbi:hypothetical protein GGU10DRAFT_351628 [Lentinula aff. detonsa]|uniref:Uncharacterized protein n=1 Tax=Lentinula aff. detonsa TaxID=2804958 RepID=A0AA38NPS8_9AGAR|nr:hypothetical protein GGU10DRAFT_351628 [Lentinula aff. detonsa]